MLQWSFRRTRPCFPWTCPSGATLALWECKLGNWSLWVTLQIHLAWGLIPTGWSKLTLKAEGQWCHKGIRWNPEGNQTMHPAAKESLCPRAKFQTLPKPFWNKSRKGSLAIYRRLQMMPALPAAFSLKSALIQLAWASKRAEDGNPLAVGLNALFQSTG